MKRWADRARDAVATAAASRGMDVAGVRVLRVGENAVVLLPAAAILARVIPDLQLVGQVRHELDVAMWFASAGLPVARPVVVEPLLANGYVISLWEHLVDARPADLVTLAGCLRRLHSVAIPRHVDLQPVDPFARFARRLETGKTLDDGDRVFLVEMRDRLRREWQQVRFDRPRSVLHGDAHMENLLVAPDGRLAFVDLENVATGPPEWDLTLTALYYECGWFSSSAYSEFGAAYGFDVRTSTAWPVLRGIQMLRMTTWLAQTAADYPEREEQLRHRIASLRDGTAPQDWTGF